jgi:catechol 2,3-dioxygenase-like lactoylglutathione lyase family enzyme
MADTEAEVNRAQAAPASASTASASTASASTGPERTAPVSTAPASTAAEGAGPARTQPAAGMIHHIELWVPNLDRAIHSWGWLLGALGYRLYQDWPGGRSWGAGHSYIVVEQSPARTAGRHDRCRPGMNHLAFFAADRPHVDELVAEALLHGWRLLFTDLHPYAGGDHHYAAYLENADGFEVELVAGS